MTRPGEKTRWKLPNPWSNTNKEILDSSLSLIPLINTRNKKVELKIHRMDWNELLKK